MISKQAVPRDVRRCSSIMTMRRNGTCPRSGSPTGSSRISRKQLHAFYRAVRPKWDALEEIIMIDNGKALIERFRELRVLVIGDSMLDRYVEGSCSRLCPEGP